METYSLLREFADSWVLLFLFLFFGCAVFYVLRPGSRELHKDSANIPFRHEDNPASEDDIEVTRETFKEARQ